MGWKYTEAQVEKMLGHKPLNRRRHKYNAVKVQIDGIKFDSKAEARRYGELKLIDPNSLIVHPRFPIRVNGITVCDVVLDFQYWPSPGDCQPIYEDVKGVDTAVSRLKRKMVEAAYGIKVQVIKSKVAAPAEAKAGTVHRKRKG